MPRVKSKKEIDRINRRFVIEDNVNQINGRISRLIPPCIIALGYQVATGRVSSKKFANDVIEQAEIIADLLEAKRLTALRRALKGK